VCCSVLQCVAVCCSVLQCVAVCCSVLQCVIRGGTAVVTGSYSDPRAATWVVHFLAACCSVLQSVALCCSICSRAHKVCCTMQRVTGPYLCGTSHESWVMNQSCHTNEDGLSHTRRGHVTHMHASCRTYKWVTARAHENVMSRITSTLYACIHIIASIYTYTYYTYKYVHVMTNESWHAHECVMSHITST